MILLIQNLEIIKSDLEKNLIFIKGSIPGSKNTVVYIKNSIKKINRKTTIEKIQSGVKNVFLLKILPGCKQITYLT